MSQGASALHSVSYVSENTIFTTGGNPALIGNWMWTLISRASGADQQSVAYSVNGTALSVNSSSHPTDTPNLSNDATSWGDALNAAIAFFDGKASTRMVFSSQITVGSADFNALETWFEAR
jgi:hypothetical protein